MSGSAPGKKRAELSAESFGRLLAWLDADRDRAGQKYEKIRRGLIKIFNCKGCAVPEELADESINRVAGKVYEVADGYIGEPASYFYAVAEKIYLEYLRTESSQLRPLPADLPTKKSAGKEIEIMYACLEQCIDRLPASSRELIRAYYGDHQTGKQKAERKRELAARMSVATNMLWLKAHRIRAGLKKCVQQCLERKQTGLGPN